MTSMRYDKLHLQEPPAGPFSAADLEWIDEAACIPAARVPDFLAGEGQQKDHPCQFFIGHSAKQKLSEVKKLQWNSKSSYHIYFCAYGTHSSRKKAKEKILELQELRQSKRNVKPKKTGCQCRFTVTELLQQEGRAYIKYIERAHTGHGLHQGSKLAPRLSSSKKEWVSSLVRRGFSNRSILELHQEEVKKKDPSTLQRDDFLNAKDINNISTKMKAGKIQGETIQHDDEPVETIEHDEDPGESFRTGTQSLETRENEPGAEARSGEAREQYLELVQRFLALADDADEQKLMMLTRMLKKFLREARAYQPGNSRKRARLFADRSDRVKRKRHFEAWRGKAMNLSEFEAEFERRKQKKAILNALFAMRNQT